MSSLGLLNRITFMRFLVGVVPKNWSSHCPFRPHHSNMYVDAAYTVNPKGVGVHPQGWSILHTLGCKYAPSPKGV